jgi:hypothetical protein
VNIVINPYKIDVAFNSIRLLLSGLKDGRLLSQFYNQFYEEDGIYPYLKIDKRKKSVTFMNQISESDWVEATETFENYFTKELNKILVVLKREISKYIVDAPDGEAVEQYRNQFYTTVKEVNKEAKTIKEPIIRKILAIELKKLEIKSAHSHGNQSRMNNTNRKAVLDIPKVFVSNNFSDKYIEVVESLYAQLTTGRFIKSTFRTFGLVFTEEDRDRPVQTKINWIGEIGHLRYFINQIESQFELIGVNRTKWHTADLCFKIKGKNYNFAKEGSNGKYGSDSEKRIIKGIVKKAKSLIINDSEENK